MSVIASLGGAAHAQEAPFPGTLILSDFFQERGEGLPHGEIVYRSARQTGFTGPILKRETPENREIDRSRNFSAHLEQKPLTPESTRALIRQYASDSQIGSLKSATDELNDIYASGVRNSVVNFSKGSGKAQIVEALYQNFQQSWTDAGDPTTQTRATIRIKKVAGAYDLDAAKLMSGSKTERARLQQAIVAEVDRASENNLELQAAQAKYDAAVNQLQDEHKTCVVVSAANSGQILETMAKDTDSPLLPIAADFYLNRLANPATVMVGATHLVDKKETVADYTNPDKGMDAYANGDAYVDAQDPGHLVNYGTSFAAPRHSAPLTETLKRHPDWTCGQAESFVKHTLSYTLDSYGVYQPAPALNATKVSDFFKQP